MAKKRKRESAISIEDFSVNKQYSKMILSQNEKSQNVFGNSRGKSFNYSQSEVRAMIKDYRNPTNQEKLREISEFLYIQNQQYQRLINYYANISTYSYTVIPSKDILDIDTDKLRKDYNKVTEMLGIFNIRNNFTKIVRKAMILDTFFGYIISDKRSVMIQQFPNDICQITSLEYDSYNYAIDLSYFENDIETLDYYPQEVKKAFAVYQSKLKNAKNKNLVDKWYELSAKNSICIKINEGISESIPPFAGVFDSVYDINAFKDLRNDKAELENYKLLVQGLPLRKNSLDNNDFLIDLPMMNYFHNSLADIVPANVGVATSPMEIEVVTFDKDTADRDGVAKANKDFWDNSGTSQTLFSSDNKTSQGITQSIKTDEQVIFTIMTQLERWLNRYILLNNHSKFFKVTMLESTHFNKDELQGSYLELGQNGFPVSTIIASLRKIEPVSFEGLIHLENEVLGLNDKMVPFKSSFNTGSDDVDSDPLSGGDGRPTNEELGTQDADETQRARDKSTNVE